MALNEKAIDPFYEAKSDLEIARGLTSKLNELSPGFSNFPYQMTSIDWIEQEFTPEICRRLGIGTWRDLLRRPRKLKVEVIPWQDRQFTTPTRNFELYSEKAKAQGLPALPKFHQPKAPDYRYPLRLLTPQSLSQIHSQYLCLSWLTADTDQLGTFVELNNYTAQKKGLKEGDWVAVFNGAGSFSARLRLNPTIPLDIAVTSQGGLKETVNELVTYLPTDMGQEYTGCQGNAFYDVYVDVEKKRGNGHG